MTDVDDDGAPRGRLAEVVEAVNAAHPDREVPCGGLESCGACQDLWRRLTGGGRGVCMVCGCRHWPWERHDADGVDERGAP